MPIDRRAFLGTLGLGCVAASAVAACSSSTESSAAQTPGSPEEPGPPVVNDKGITDGYVRVDEELVIHYQTAGSGQTAIVFVPGWVMSTDVFEHQLAHFANSDQFTAITYDPRAQGRSTVTIEGHFYEQRARDLQALLNKLGVGEYILVGWSAGGGDVLEHVRLFGHDNLKGLVLLDTPPKVRGYDYTTEWLWFGTKDNGDQDGQMKYYSYDSLIDRDRVNTEFAQWMLDDASPEKVQFLVDIANRTPNSIASLLNSSYWYLDNTAQIVELNGTVPLFFFTREETGELAAAWARTNAPQARVQSYGKHVMFWEHPDVFNRGMDSFLSVNA